MKRFYLLLLILTPLLSKAQLAIPELWGVRIHDEAKVLSTPFINSLEQQLKRHEDSTSNQIAVLIVPSLNGEILEEYTLRVAETWKLGKAKTDNGVLLFIAIEDRKARIEVGEGLEGALPDAIANQIIRNELAPYFRQQNYEGGVQVTINAILKAIRGEYKADPQASNKWKGRGGSFSSLFLIIIVIIILSRLFGGRGGGRRGGGGWMMGPTWYGGGWSGRSGGGGWSGGGGGFSGGGGGFSGGGSSGSW